MSSKANNFAPTRDRNASFQIVDVVRVDIALPELAAVVQCAKFCIHRGLLDQWSPFPSEGVRRYDIVLLCVQAQLARWPLGHDGLVRHDGLDSLVARTERGGRGSASPLFGQNNIARSASAVIISDGFTPRLAGITLPSVTCKPGWPNTRW